MRRGINEAAVDQRQRGNREARGHGHAISAIAVEQHRIAAVEGDALAIEQRHRHGLAVRGGGEEPAGLVGGGVVPGGDFLLLAQHPFAGRKIEVVNP